MIPMHSQIPQDVLDRLMETLAGVEHERWSHWQRYMHSKCERKSDGSLMIPPELVDQWERQIATSYADLSEAEKESDRDQVRRYLPIILKALNISANALLAEDCDGNAPN
jgi:hypothetical protein